MRVESVLDPVFVTMWRWRAHLQVRDAASQHYSEQLVRMTYMSSVHYSKVSVRPFTFHLLTCMPIDICGR